MSRAVDLVKKGEAAAIVSAGHTGAAVAATTIKLRTLPGIDRPGIAAIMPSETNIFVLIDAGANSDARAEHLTAIRDYGFGLFPSRARLRTADGRLDVDRRRRRERERPHEGSLQNAEAQRAQFPRQHSKGTTSLAIRWRSWSATVLSAM